ncbi:MAG: hypothetical protein ACFWT2_11610 [Thermoanaerobacterium thermosaccharolyticum]|jgi:hypothetical protein
MENQEEIELKKILQDVILKQKLKRENYLKETFTNIPEKYLSEIYATAICYDKPMTSCIYFIRNNYNGRIKIGSTQNIIKRFKELNRIFESIGLHANLEIIALYLTFDIFRLNLEKTFQKDFQEFQYKNEWYDITAEQVQKYFTEATNEYDYINNVILDYSENEYLFWEHIKKDFSILETEIKLEIKKIMYEKNLINYNITDIFAQLMNEKAKNPLYQIARNVAKYKTGFGVKHYEIRENKIWNIIIGISNPNSNEILNFQDLKRYKYNRNYWQEILSSLVINR